MIDFSNRTFPNLAAADPGTLGADLDGHLLPEERVVIAFRNAREMVVVTDKRLICTSAEGLAGRKQHHASVPLRRLAAWSAVILGQPGEESGLDLWLDGFGHLRLEFARGVDIVAVGRHLGQLVL